MENNAIKPKLLFFTNIDSNGYLNMAIDDYFIAKILENNYEKNNIDGVLRFYTFSSPTITIGYFQKTDIFSKEKLNNNRISIIRRLTGGNAIYHDKYSFTYSIILNRDILNLKTNKDIYLFTAKILKDGLLKLGIDTIIEDTTSTNDKNYDMNYDCFSSLSQYEIKRKDGNKLIGSAQKIFKNLFLQQGVFLNSYSPKNLEFFLKNIEKDMDINSLIKIDINSFIKNEENIRIINGENIQINDIIKSFKESFSEYMELINYEISSEDNLEIEKLVNSKYSRDEWNYKK